eukprot:1160804-Pelagomonas_calceolata.AAC.30
MADDNAHLVPAGIRRDNVLCVELALYVGRAHHADVVQAWRGVAGQHARSIALYLDDDTCGIGAAAECWAPASHFAP